MKRKEKREKRKEKNKKQWQTENSDQPIVLNT